MIHEDFKCNGEDIEFHALPRYCKVVKEGDPSNFFNAIEGGANETENVGPAEGVPIDDEVAAAMRIVPTEEENINRIDTAGITIDDDNAPAPENIPGGSNEPVESVFKDWDYFTGICPRRSAGVHNVQPKLKHFPADINPTKLQLFELLFPKSFIKETILPCINKPIVGNKCDYGEFLVFIGIWMLMGTLQGFHCREFWSTLPVTPLPTGSGAPYRFNSIMSRSRFDEILRCLNYTRDDPPEYQDRFWVVRDLIEAWNNNMDENFSASWISCLDESMSTWMNEYTCPGFMFVPRKPHPFGNEYHTICCCVSGVLYRVELVEGKDEPPRRGRKEYEELGKTVGLLLRVTKPLWGTGRVVVLDSGFCVLKGIVELKKKGVYAAAQIKKRRYWPKHVDGDAIKAYFADKEVGSIGALPGKLDGVPVWIHCMKEPDYITMLMSSYGTLERKGEERPRKWKENGVVKRTKFKYPEIVYNHYQNRHHVDDHNNRRHQPISLEETWATKYWPHRVFAFLLAVTEGNMFLLHKRLSDDAEDNILAFRRSWGMELIENPYLKIPEPLSTSKAKRQKASPGHKHLMLPRGKKFAGPSIVDAQSDYPQTKCIGCDKRVRNYCSCSPGTVRCVDCFGKHLLDTKP